MLKKQWVGDLSASGVRIIINTELGRLFVEYFIVGNGALYFEMILFLRELGVVELWVVMIEEIADGLLSCN